MKNWQRPLRWALAAIAIWSCSFNAGAADDTAAAATELGLTPESLVASGFTTTDAAVILYRIETAATLRQNLANTHELTATAAQQVTALATLLQNGDTDDTAVQAYESAVQQFETARAQVVSGRNALLEAGLDGFPAAMIQKLTMFREGAGMGVPAELRVVQRTTAQWAQIKRALRAEKRAIRRGEDLDETHANLLTTVRSDAAVVTAASNLSQGLDAMRALFVSHME